MLAIVVKRERSRVGLTQNELAKRVGVGLRFVRELEQGKESLRLDKVNQVLRFFGYVAGALPISHQLTEEAIEKCTKPTRLAAFNPAED